MYYSHLAAPPVLLSEKLSFEGKSIGDWDGPRWGLGWGRDWRLGLEIGIRDLDWGLGLGIGIGDWDWGFGLVLGMGD